MANASMVWVTFDTPVDGDDHADAAWVRTQVEAVRSHLAPGTVVVVSSQVPVGFTRSLENDWQSSLPDVTFVCSPENLRLGQAIAVFRAPGRVVVGLGKGANRERLARLFAPFCDRMVWMSLESAEMTKHALNSFLAVQVVYTNELARLCERVGADAGDVERALRSDPRIGEKAYVAPGPPLAGGTLARDVEFLRALAASHGLESPVVEGVVRSNDLHTCWTHDRLNELLAGINAPRVALLGLTYKAGTDTLRRSASIELGRWLVQRGVDVRAFDPAVRSASSPELEGLQLTTSLDDVLSGADAAVVATPWPEFTTLTAEQLVRAMRAPCLVDQAGFLGHLADDPRLTYIRVGRPAQERLE
jgi:UDPglucose 6-dehydrogenase